MNVDVVHGDPTVAPALLARVLARFAPPPLLTVSQFADHEIIVTTGPLAGTHWQNDFAPYQRGILDAFHEPGVQTVVVMGSSQWGKTACAVVVVAYHIAHDPCTILVVEPTVDPMAKDFARNRLEPVIAASRILSDVVSKKRAKDSSNTVLAKTFRGGAVAIGGANSAASLASRAVRLLVLDEIDRYPPELPGEGSTIAIAMKRTTSYGRRRRVLILSSPTLRGAPIDAWFERGDQRRFQVPCHACGVLFAYQWSQVRWTDDDPATTRIHCPHCDHGLDDVERVAVLAKGEWIAEHPDRRDHSIVSFHMWEAYSPLSSLAAIVSGFLQARADQKRGDASTMHTWENTTLGEPLEPDHGEGIEPHGLIARREVFAAAVPDGACLLTMGVDVQDDRLEVLVVGWGPGEEAWIIDRDTLGGDTSQPEPWSALDELLDREYVHERGVSLSVQATCIDSGGHRTTMVYDYAARKAARRVYAIIGRDGQRPLVSSPSPRRWGGGQRKVPLYTIGVDAAKALWMSRLALTEKSRGYVHLPMAEWCIAEGELVQMADGTLKPIGQVKVGDYALSLDTNGRPVSRRVIARVDQGVKPCVRVVPKYGTPIVCTADHDLYWGYKRTSKAPAASASRVAQPRCGWWPKKTTDKSDAWYVWAALVVSEGCIRYHKVTCGAIEQMEQAIALLPPEARVRRHNFIGIHADHVPDWFLLWPEFWRLQPRHSAGEKMIPNWVFTSSREKVRLFLRWLYLGDGWASGHRVGYATTSPRLAQQIVVLLNRFGIRSTHRVRRSVRATWADQYWVQIHRSSDVLEFCDAIGMEGKPKAVADVRAEAVRRMGSKRVARAHFIQHGRREFTAQSEANRLKASRVIAIEDAGERRVYDITVEGEHRFLCGTCLVSNCDDELAAQLTSERLKRRFTKGVPVQVWVKARPRNEALDCAVYALAALRLVHPDLDAIAARMHAAPKPAAPVTPAPEKKLRWIPPRREGGWLKGRRP